MSPIFRVLPIFCTEYVNNIPEAYNGSVVLDYKACVHQYKINDWRYNVAQINSHCVVRVHTILAVRSDPQGVVIVSIVKDQQIIMLTLSPQ